MNQVPEYLRNNILNLNEQWTRIVNLYNRLNPSVHYKSRRDPVSLEGLHREGTISVGGRSYNPSTVIQLLNTLSQNQDSVAPSVGETGVSLDDFIRSTIQPIAAIDMADGDPSHIKLYIDDGQNIRLLNQPELNWFFTGSWDQHNQTPVIGLKNPTTNGPLSISDLNNLYNLFFKANQTRSGAEYGRGGMTIKRKKANRANRSSRRRTSTKRRTTRRHRRR
jgi:hypothetical protein